MKHLVSDGRDLFSVILRDWEVATANPKKGLSSLCIWLVDSLITISISTWFSCINTHNNKFCPFTSSGFSQTVSIVSRTEELIIPS